LPHTIEEERTTLQRVLKRASYATSDMLAEGGDAHQAEIVIIRRIEAGTIPTENYPLSRRRRHNADPASLAVWENEGGAMRQSKGKPVIEPPF
jgi:hypothetical protein